MLERASPVQQRKALEVANLYVKAGIGFVPVPVASAAEFDSLTKMSMEKLAVLEAAASTTEASLAESPATQELGEKGEAA